MAWSFVGVSSPVAVASGNVTMTEPAGVASGDLLVACIGFRSNVAFAVPSGWSLMTQKNAGNTATNASGVGAVMMAYIVRGASAPALTFTRTAGDAAIGQIVAYRGNTATPFVAADSLTLAAGSTAVQLPTFSASIQSNDLFVIAVGGGGDTTFSAFNNSTSGTASGATDTSSAPSGSQTYERADSLTTLGADTTLAIADGLFNSNASATGSFNTTAAGSFLHAIAAGVFRMDSAGGPVSNAQFFRFF